MTRPEHIIDDFDSIRRYLNRLENERARSKSAPSVVVEEDEIEEGKSEDRISLSQLWISGKV